MPHKRETTVQNGQFGKGFRAEAVKLKTAKGRSSSSQRWLHRQLNDPYVQEAQRLGYRSRSAFKILQLNDRFTFFKVGQKVIDLGAAPGGWTQVAAKKVLKEGGTGQVTALDRVEMEPIPGTRFVKGDFMSMEVIDRLALSLDGRTDLILSDMAAPTTGHAATDHLRTIALCEAAYEFAVGVLAFGGGFVSKVFKGGSERNLLKCMKQDFEFVRHAKPAASRTESPETYVVAVGFRKGK